VADLAQRDVDRLASDSYQLGADLSGGLGEWAAVVDSVFRDGGIQDLADRTSSLGLVAADHRHRMMSAADLQLRAVQAELVASSAASALAQREVTVLAAAEAVRAETVVQRDEVRRLTAVRDAATLTLRRTHARATTLHAARAAALARAAAAARAAADARRARAARRDPDTSGQAWPDGTSTASRAQRLAALAFAEAQLGDPYVAGADGPDAYDCSGLTSAAYRSVGIAMVQYSQTQFVSYRKVPISQLQPGDLVFFGTDPSNWHTIHHVGIYAGGGQMVEAPHTGDVVKFFTIWQDQLVAFGARP
jgi:cell wall-associated NlpC family hydrolase